MALFTSKSDKFKEAYTKAIKFYQQNDLKNAYDTIKKANSLIEDLEGIKFQFMLSMKLDKVEEQKLLINKLKKLVNIDNLLKNAEKNYLEGKLDEAISEYEIAFQITDDIQFKIKIAEIYGIQNEDKAFEIYNELYKTNPDNLEILCGLGFFLWNKNRYNDALEYFQTASKISPNNSFILNNIALLQSRLNMTEESIKNFEKAISLDSDNPIIHINLGNLYFSIGNFKKATEEFRIASEIEPFFEGIHSVLNKGQFSFNDTIENIKELENELEQVENKAEQLNKLAMLYIRNGDIQTAIELLKQAINLEPNLTIAYSNLGFAYGETGQLFKAIQSFKMGIKIIPDSAFLHNNLALFYDYNGKEDEAIKEYKLAAELDPHYAQTHYIMGMMYQSKGFNNRAIKHYKRFLETSKDENLKQIVRTKLNTELKT